VDQSLNRRLVEVTQIRSRLTRLLSHYQRLWGDKTECVDDDFALDGLYRVNDDGYGARSKLLEGLLGVDIDGGKPAAETWM
jgi:hypothetical protein